MKKYITKNQKGFTLIETILYSALLAIFLSATFLFVNNILSTSGNILERNELAANKEFIDYKLNWLISQATDVTVPAPGLSAASITITGPTPTIYPAVITLSNGQLMLSLAGAAANPITNNRIKVTSFIASHIDTSTDLQEMRVTINAQSSTKPNIVSTGDVFSYVIP